MWKLFLQGLKQVFVSLSYFVFKEPYHFKVPVCFQKIENVLKTGKEQICIKNSVSLGGWKFVHQPIWLPFTNVTLVTSSQHLARNRIYKLFPRVFLTSRVGLLLRHIPVENRVYCLNTPRCVIKAIWNNIIWFIIPRSTLCQWHFKYTCLDSKIYHSFRHWFIRHFFQSFNSLQSVIIVKFWESFNQLSWAWL